VVGFVLPSAEKDMCLSEPNKGMLGKSRTAYWLLFVVFPGQCPSPFPAIFSIIDFKKVFYYKL